MRGQKQRKGRAHTAPSRQLRSLSRSFLGLRAENRHGATSLLDRRRRALGGIGHFQRNLHGELAGAEHADAILGAPQHPGSQRLFDQDAPTEAARAIELRGDD